MAHVGKRDFAIFNLALVHHVNIKKSMMRGHETSTLSFGFRV